MSHRLQRAAVGCPRLEVHTPISCVGRRHLARVLWGRRRQCRTVSIAAVGQLGGLAVEYYLGLFKIPPGVWQDGQVSMGVADCSR